MPLTMTKITLDDQLLDVDPKSTIIDICEKQGIEIPRFCYHPKLSVAGCCRMCFVEVEKNPKPVVSCAFPVAEGMVIKTNTEMVKKARENVLELLLINHPLDCPVCDQGGECDLQDITLHYAKGQSQYDFEKRDVSNKNMGPLVKTVMTRCIHCTRCIRFMNEIAGCPEIGALYRGKDMEITTYLERNLHTELSGNLIDICPVGALTNKPYAYQGRSWEYEKTPSIDIHDAVGSNIEIHTRDNEIMRIVPRDHEDINECWINDKVRFGFDGLYSQRLDRPYIRVNGKLQESTWDNAFLHIKQHFEPLDAHQIAALSGDLSDCESVYMLKELMHKIGSAHMDCRPVGSKIDANNRFSYLFNTSIHSIEDADCILLVGTNPKKEASLVNARILKAYRKNNIPIASIGAVQSLNYPYEDLGNNVKVLKDILDKNHPFSKTWYNSKKPLLILAESATRRRDGLLIQKIAQDLCSHVVSSGWYGYSMLHTHPGILAGLDLSFVPGLQGYSTQDILEQSKKGKIKALYLLGVDHYTRANVGDDVFVIYQGHHGDNGAQMADVILPGVAYTEKSALYLNTEGRAQLTQKAVSPVGLAKEDWKIIKVLSDILKTPILIDDIDQLRKKLSFIHDRYKNIGQLPPIDYKETNPSIPETLSHIPLEETLDNFYMTDVITKHSSLMAHCLRESS